MEQLLPRDSEYQKKSERSEEEKDHTTDEDEDYYVEEEVPTMKLRTYEQNGQLKYNSRLNANSELASSLDGGTLGNGLASHRQSAVNNAALAFP